MQYDEIIKRIEEALNSISINVSKAQLKVNDELLELMQGLELKGGKIVLNYKNLKQFIKIKAKIRVLSNTATEQVSKPLLSVFNSINELHNKYYYDSATNKDWAIQLRDASYEEASEIIKTSNAK